MKVSSPIKACHGHDALIGLAETSFVSVHNRRRTDATTVSKARRDGGTVPTSRSHPAKPCHRARVAHQGHERKPILRFQPDATEEEAARPAQAGLSTFRVHVYKPEMTRTSARGGQAYRERLEFEINTIVKMVSPATHIVADLSVAKEHDIPWVRAVVRAGSVVAWALTITT